MEEKQVHEPEEKAGIGHIVVNIIGGLLCIIFIPIIIMNVVLIVQSYVNRDKLPMVFGYSPVIVLSGSMFPTFEAGDMILLQETDPSTLEEGDIICYLVDSAEDSVEKVAVTHRIVSVQQQNGENVFITQGDANNIEDRIVVTQDQVQGEFPEESGIILSGLGNLAVFLQSPTGMIVFIVCPIVLFLFWDLARRAFAIRKDKKEEESLRKELELLRAQVAQGGSPEAPDSPQE